MAQLIIRSDPRGNRPLAGPPGRWRLLTPRQHDLVWNVPLVGATVRFLAVLHGVDGQLTALGCREAARACRAAAIAIDLRRAAEGDAPPVDVSVLLGRISVTTRDTARDLRRFAGDQTGRWEVVILPRYQDRLAQVDAYDPATTDNPLLATWVEGFVIRMLDDVRYQRVGI